jgi:N6-L-threonylcarbamoyladenine synthase
VVVSGGHTSMFLLRGFLEFEMIGKTRDDALGEAFDKVAKVLNLGFPGGPIIERRAEKAKAKNISFSTPAIKDSLDFSYSGLKTAVLYYLKDKERISSEMINEICYGFQESALKALLGQIERAILKFKVKRLLVGGGVALNKRLREMLRELDLEVFLPSPDLCTDNAAMVAGLGYQLYNSKLRSRSDFQPYSRFEEKWKLK